MLWPEERYVKLYTRDTTDWLLLSWKAQGLFCLLLRKVNKAGQLPLGKRGKQGVAAHIGGGTAWPEIELALNELLTDGCVSIDGELLIVPNYCAAQEAAQSPALRKKTQRERERVTNGHAVSPGVTQSRDESRNVTLSQLSQNIPEGEYPPSSVTRSHAEEQPRDTSVTQQTDSAACTAPRALKALLEAAGGRVRVGKDQGTTTGLSFTQEAAWMSAWRDCGEPYGEAGARRLGEGLASKAIYNTDRPISVGELIRHLPDLLAQAADADHGRPPPAAEEPLVYPEFDMRKYSRVIE